MSSVRANLASTIMRATTLGHFIIILIFPKLLQYLPRERRAATKLRISYKDGLGLLRTILIVCSKLRFVIDRVELERENSLEAAREELDDLADFEGVAPERLGKGVVVHSMQVKGKRPVSHLIARLAEIDGVIGVGSVSNDVDSE